MNQPTEFKTTAIGGFNRQDVIDYITRQAEEYRQQREQWETQRQEMERRLEQLEQEKQHLAAQLDESSQAAAQAKSLQIELTNQRSQCAVLESENASLRQQVEQLKPAAEAYGHVKDSLAEMELGARSRADEIIKRAQMTSWQTYEQADARLNQVRESYHAAQIQMDATVEHTLRGLISIRDIMRDLTQTFSQCDEFMENLRVAREDDRDG